MATKTVNRQTFSVDYDLDDLNQGMFSMTEFKGICDRENDVTVDQSTFSKAENVYVNDNSVLASRAPFKFADGEAHIVDELYFGVYGLRVYKQVSGSTYTFTIACFTHETYNNHIDKFSTYQFVYSGTDDITLDIPKVTGIQIEDKVFIWFAGQGIIVFNTAGYYDEASGKNLPFFEDAYKYLYIPAHTLVTNGFESELEAQNFLTDSYIKRYLYNSASQISTKDIKDKHLSVYSIDDGGNRNHLYDTIGEDKNMFSDKHIYIGNPDDYYVDVKYVNGVIITLRYHKTLHTIEISYGTPIFKTVPMPDNIVFRWLKLTEDGLYLVGTAGSYLYWCAIVSVTSDESQLNDEFVWEKEMLDSTFSADSYTRNSVVGRFLSRENYGYIWTRLINTDDFRTNLVIRQGDYVDNFIDERFLWLEPTEEGQYEDTSRFDFVLRNFAPANPQTYFCYFTFLSTEELLGYVYPTNTDNPTRPDNLSLGTGDVYFGAYIRIDTNIHCIGGYCPWLDTDTFAMNRIEDVGYYLSDLSRTVHETEPIIDITSYFDFRHQRNTMYIDSFYAFSPSITVNDTSSSLSIKYKNASPTQINLLNVRDDKIFYRYDSNNVCSENHIGFREDDLSGYKLIPWTSLDNVYAIFYYNNTDIIYLNSDGYLCTSLSNFVELEIDTYENVTYDDDGNMIINFRPDVPDCFSALGDYYISFATIEDGQFRLLMSDTRRDDETNDFLLYLPDTSEQKFSQRITNLHPLADDTMGIFTEDEIWYIQALNLDNESVTRYTKAVKSKLPVGCRQGNDVITADNGQAILFAVPRGIVYLTPQDFVSTTDRQINYISDAIQNIYNEYYFDSVKNSNAHEYKITIPSQIKIMTYSYWICFYRYMDNQILLIDTRSNSWWKWKTPYPILKLNNNGNLTVLMQIEKSKDAEDYSASLGGVSYLYCNLSYYLYQDDVLEDYIDGTYVIQTSVYGERIEYQYASPVIDWTFTTQKLHFGAINNYKYIRAININTNGEGKLVAKYTTKAYRDLYHPEASVTREIKINDLRTYVNRCNLLHVVNFALSLSSEDVLMVEPLSLNSISVKYEIKGQVR